MCFLLRVHILPIMKSRARWFNKPPLSHSFICPFIYTIIYTCAQSTSRVFVTCHSSERSEMKKIVNFLCEINLEKPYVVRVFGSHYFINFYQRENALESNPALSLAETLSPKLLKFTVCHICLSLVSGARRMTTKRPLKREWKTPYIMMILRILHLVSSFWDSGLRVMRGFHCYLHYGPHRAALPSYPATLSIPSLPA